MFWLKQYCKQHTLTISGSHIYKNKTLVGEINFYDEHDKFVNQDYLYKFGDFALGLIEQETFHRSNNETSL